MQLLKNTGFALLAGAILLILSSWGSTGHYKISYNSQLSFNQEMEQFYEWAQVLADHASDADARKAWDPDEGPKHYIDIDNYPEFNTTGTIPQDFTEIVAAHGFNFVIDQGILPWATEIAFDSLQSCFERSDWDKAVLFASDLGHYVADGHMPLHITKNYNGQNSGNYGIHSRYESSMINTYISQIYYSGESIATITDVNQYIFDYLYNNYTLVDSVLAADDYAKAIAGNTSSNLYYESLWEKTHGFTKELFKSASNRLAALIYTAWVNAGSPLISGIFNPYSTEQPYKLRVNPNPASFKTQISFRMQASKKISLTVINSQGKKVCTLMDGMSETGDNNLTYNTSELPPGLYYILLESDKKNALQKMIVSR